VSRKPKSAEPRPGDVFPESGNRLPPIDRAALDSAGQAIYDEIIADPRTLAGLRGPAGIQLRSPRYYMLHRPSNQMLRFDSGLEPRLRELAILVTAREFDSAFEWHAHDSEGQRQGLEREIIEVVRRRKSVRGLGPKEAAIIKLGREALGKHRVRRSTYAAALQLFGAEVLINLVALFGSYAATATMLAVFAQQLPDGEKSTLD
jgi:4-carboxymuconolactone decarboxylase